MKFFFYHCFILSFIFINHNKSGSYNINEVKPISSPLYRTDQEKKRGLRESLSWREEKRQLQSPHLRESRKRDPLLVKAEINQISITKISPALEKSPTPSLSPLSLKKNLSPPSPPSSSASPSSVQDPESTSSLQNSWETEPASMQQEKFRLRQRKTNKSRWTLFKWLNEQNISLQWAYAFLEKENKYAPKLLKEKINKNFKNDSLLYFNFYQNIFQLPYIFKWGLKASAGFTRNEDVASLSFFPLSLSVITHLQIFRHQFILPFFEMGYSIWNVDYSDFSTLFPFWGAGALISFSLFKPSLQYTLLDEYGIKDIGINLELRNNSSPMSFFTKDRGYFFRSFHLGIYFHF
ncbi:MAG: hypothetical protein OXM55_02920 [Bdellovibrionales bacterium]|nr:hypothetical protein [Bdellovibrionales bacterium]